MTEELPKFSYFPDPLGNGCIVPLETKCKCCGQHRQYMYTGPIFCEEEKEEVCPWCIANGLAANKWPAFFNSIHNVPSGVPKTVLDIISYQTPGYENWQDHSWLFSATDALVFVGEVIGANLISEVNNHKIEACMNALSELKFDRMIDNLKHVEIGGSPAIYLFQDKDTGAYRAYADMC